MTSEPHKLIPALNKLLARLDACSSIIGRCIAWLLLMMMVFTAVIVVLRYFFDIGSIAMQESVIYMHALVFLLGTPFALQRDAHVRVDIFYQSLTPRRKAFINLAGTVVFLLPVTGFVTWVSWSYVSFSWSVLEGSAEPGGLPYVFLLKTVIPLAMILLLLQGIAECIRSLLLIAQQNLDDVA